MGRARARERAAAEQRPAQVRRAAARASHDPLRWPLERRETVADHARLAQHAQRPVVARDMELVPRLPPERMSLIGADLGGEAELAQETEGAPGRSGAREVEVERDLAASTEVQAARGMRETRELGEPVALLPRHDPRELVPEVLRQRHLRAPAADACTRVRAIRTSPARPRRRRDGTGRPARIGSARTPSRRHAARSGVRPGPQPPRT